MIDAQRREIRERYRLRKRKRLLIENEDAVYHVVSRTPSKQHLFGQKEKEKFRELMWRQAQFSGVEILAYCIMSNHFHILVRIPYLKEIDDALLIERYKKLYARDYVPPTSLTVSELKFLLASGGEEAEQERARLKTRMGSLPHFIKELKQRYSIWYNRNHDNKGTIWSERYRSLIVQNSTESLSLVAAYIDLNPVRAEMVNDPAEYPFCGYADAMGGHSLARKGLQFVMNRAYWKSSISSYRLILFGKGYGTKGIPHKDKGRISGESLLEVIKNKGEVSLEEALLCRIRYLTDGVALGEAAFIEGVFEKNRAFFSSKRKDGSRKMLGSFWGNLRSARDLKKDLFD